MRIQTQIYWGVSRGCVLLLFTVLFCGGQWGMAARFAHGAKVTFANACGDGRVDKIIDPFKNSALWSRCCSDNGTKRVLITPTEHGCSGTALAVDYDLGDGDWFVIWRSFKSPLDLSPYTHLRVALKGTNGKAHHNLQIKLQGGNDSVHWVVAQSVTDLPVWRVAYFDLREFTCFDDASKCTGQVPLDLSAIKRIQIGIARCLNASGEQCEADSEDNNTLFFDELAAVDLRPGAPNRLIQNKFATITPNANVRLKAAQALLLHQDATALVPAWFEENPPIYNTYSQALSLIVFVKEYSSTKNLAYKRAANRLAAKLLQLQLPQEKANAGAWYTACKVAGNKLVPADPSCHGNEVTPAEIDRCSWIGNTAWAVIALHHLKDSGIFGQPAKLDAAINSGASWIEKQIGRDLTYPELATGGMEGNISAYFGLLAAGKTTTASQLADAIYLHGWDNLEKRMKIGAGHSDYATAMDTAGSWGVTFLRSIGKEQDALSSQAYAASLLRTASFSKTNDAGRFVYGYGDIAGPWVTTVEFSAQGAAAGILNANYVMNQIHALQLDDGSFPGCTDDFFGGTVPSWCTRMTGVAPTAWVYFTQTQDPLLHLFKSPPP